MKWSLLQHSTAGEPSSGNTALIGQDPARYDGYDFGNVSQRIGDIDAPHGKRSFIISGTQTGHLQELDSRHYTRVMSYDAAQ